MKEFKTNLKNYRVDNGYTQELLAKLLNVSRSTVAKWENGLGLPTEESINDICKIFSITRDKLFETENTNELILEKNKKIIKYKKHRNIVLLIFIIIALITFVCSYTNNKPKYYYNESNVEFKLYNTTVLENSLQIDTTDGYVYSRLEIHSIDFTTNSKLYAVIIDTHFTPGSIAHANNLAGYDKNAKLGYGKVSMDLGNNTMDYIYSYPNNSDDIHFINPNFDGELIIDEVQFCGITLSPSSGNYACKIEYVKEKDGIYASLINSLEVENNKITHVEIPQEKYTDLSMEMRTVYFFEKNNRDNLGNDIEFSIEYEMNIDNKYYTKKINYSGQKFKNIL